jgi:transposase
MDTCEQVAIETASHAQRRQRSIEEKRRIVEETLAAGASVARVARRHAVNANQVFTGARSIVKDGWVKFRRATSCL